MFKSIYMENDRIMDIYYTKSFDEAKKRMPSFIFFEDGRYFFDWASETKSYEENEYLRVDAIIDEGIGKPFPASFTIEKIDLDLDDTDIFYEVLYNIGYYAAIIEGRNEQDTSMGFYSSIEEAKKAWEKSKYNKSWEYHDFDPCFYTAPYLYIKQRTLIS